MTALAILYVDDEAANLDVFRRTFDEDFTILTAAGGVDALKLLEEHAVAVIVSDQRMPGMLGVELLAECAARYPAMRRVLLTAYSDRELLLAAIQRGQVHDYVLKPWQADELLLRLRTQVAIAEQRAAVSAAARERDLLRSEVDALGGFGEIIGLSSGLGALAQSLDRIAATDSSCMLRGESGTGKELLAREIHRRSPRADRAFVAVHCAAFAPGVLESELFGHEAGAFTGATARRIGRFEQAHGGTLFLDEVGDLPSEVQVKLLRVLQERQLERVGGNRPIRIDIRLLSATHRNLDELVSRGTLRADLFYRLHVVPLEVPPLRQRQTDIVPLAKHFLARFGSRMGKSLSLHSSAAELLARYDWPGNVRELSNVIERAAVLADPDDTIEAGDLRFDCFGVAAPPLPAGGSVLDSIARDEERRLIAALREASGSKARAARLLGIPRTTLHERLRKFGIQ